MMYDQTFPADHELRSFFESEPKLVDAKVPWFYNTLDFETERSGIAVKCQLRPSYGEIRTRLLVGGVELMRLDLQPFKSVRLVMDEGRDLLIASFDLLIAKFDGSPRQETFGLMLKPRVWAGFGNLRSIP